MLFRGEGVKDIGEESKYGIVQNSTYIIGKKNNITYLNIKIFPMLMEVALAPFRRTVKFLHIFNLLTPLF